MYTHTRTHMQYMLLKVTSSVCCLLLVFRGHLFTPKPQPASNHRWNRNPRTQPQTFSKLVFLP